LGIAWINQGKACAGFLCCLNRQTQGAWYKFRLQMLSCQLLEDGKQAPPKHWLLKTMSTLLTLLDTFRKQGRPEWWSDYELVN